MELVAIMRALTRHRLLIALGVVVAALAGAAAHVLLSSPRGPLMTATSRVLIDARTRPALDLDSSVADTLGLRAGLLADLMMTRSARFAIARAAGVPADDLVVIGPSMDAPPLPLPLAVAATEAAAGVSERYAVSVGAKGDIPFLEVTAAAPSGREAARLVEVTQERLVDLIASRSSRGPGLDLEPLGAVITKSTRDRPTPLLPLVAALAVLGLWCVAIVLGSGLGRALGVSRGG